MKQLITLFLYTALGLCLTLFGYSLWKATLGKPATPHFDTQPRQQTAPAPPEASPEPPQPEPLPKPLLKEPANDEPVPTDEHSNSIQIAIIIDDVGYSLPHGKEAASVPGALTLAVLPHSPHGVELAELGHQSGKEIMLHVPMSTVQHRKLDTGGLTENMGQKEFETTLENNLASIPHVRGLNNHMGSELTQHAQPMQWLMTTLAQKDLFFIDSRTSAESVALQTAEANRVPTRKRDVFLDNIRTPEAIGRQFDTLIQLAQQHGSAIAIGHPYPETLAYLNQAVPRLSRQGINLVPVSRLLTATVSQKPTTQASEKLPSQNAIYN